MGWFGYGIYDGDETITRHIDFLKWAKVCESEDDALDHLGGRATILTEAEIKVLKKNIKLILNKMPKQIKYEDDAIEWQMLLALFVDNGIKPSKVIFDRGIEATNFLMGQHAEDFDEPVRRKKNLRNFIARAKRINGT